VIDGDQLLTRTRALVGAAADELLAVYRAGYPQARERDLLLLVMADHSHRMDSILLAERKFEQGGAPVYMYRFDWESPVLDGLIKAAHTYEIPFVFDNAQLCSGMTGGDVDAVALAARMSSAWIAFARTGNPNTPGLPDWPAYDTNRRATMLFNDVCAVAEDPGGAERRAWQPIRARRA
jgi:para-nitrobenzyl esterase